MFSHCTAARIRPSLTILAVLFFVGHGPAAQTSSRFEAADIHASPEAGVPYLRGGFTDRGAYELRDVTMTELISIAWNLSFAKVVGGPSWLDWDRFDLVAKVPSGATLDTVRPMLRRLLQDRFDLVVHNDTEHLPAFILSAGPKLRMKQSKGTDESGCKPDGPAGGLTVGPGGVSDFSFTCQNVTMEAFAAGMPKMTGVLAYTNNLPVVDRTNLKGAWDFQLKYSVQGGDTRYGIVPSEGDLITLSDAIRGQLGLELKQGSTPSPVLVVDRVNETPAPNPPGTAQALPPAPTEFDAADLKPSDPSSSTVRFQVRNGYVDIEGIPLADLIIKAWDVNPTEIIGMPSWAEKARFHIIARSGARPDPVPQPGVKADYDATIAMLRNLLINRFGIKTHYEERVVNTYTLVAAKPKMKAANRGGRTSCQEDPPPGVPDPRFVNPAITRVLNCTDVTMAEFCELLFQDADDYVQRPVVDETGLQGSWDFTLYFSDAAVVGAGPQLRDNRQADDNQASDPNGGISLEDAIRKQLGLRLELQKHPVTVLAIDHINEKPIPN